MARLHTSSAHCSSDTPSTSTNYPAYDVFISHRGPDVKNSFARHLYRELYVHGLQPFLDREVLQAGELLSPQIEAAIRTAYVHIAIFSPGYADSRWCLDELLLILQKPRDTIIPVFFNVKPSEVRWASKDGQYAQALNKLEDKGRYDRQTLENWRKALNDASYRVGFELEAYNGNEMKLLDNVVQCVLKKRRNIGLNVARYPTGLEDKVDDFEKAVLLQQQQQSGRVKVLGIVGMGGIGKTTLAKQLFNKKSSNFGESCFLFDVRENATRRSLNSLQTKLIKDLVHRDVQIDHIDEGVEKLKTYLSTSSHADAHRHALDDVDHADQLHALVVLDDIDHVDQLHAFLPIQDVLRWDSLILVTSRYKDVLTSSGLAESSIYNLTGLNERHSRELFCLHAFCQPCPPLEFKDIVDQFCRACHGLPLSLKVFGGLLCQNSDKSYWEWLLDELKLPKEIHQTLKLSYDALDDYEKEIFLDIACYFIGEDRDMAIRIWEGSGWNGPLRLRNLQKKCLVEVDGENTIKMHDHLRDLGRQIADEKKSGGVIPHRLSHLVENIHDLWQDYSVITEVRGIRTASHPNDIADSGVLPWFKSWCDEVLEKCLRRKPRLRKLQLVATEHGDLKNILTRVESPNLIWVRWNNCPYSFLPSWMPMKNIRILELEGNKLKTLWRTESQAPLELRQLNISAPLSNFPKSIGRLKHIEKIVLRRSHLKSLPEEFSHLLSLKYLLLRDEHLTSLQVSFGCLTSLQHLDLTGCDSLQGLPDSFGCLTSLQHLDLTGCDSLQGLPDSFWCLTSLQHLDLSECLSVQGLPDSFGCLTSLQHLDLKWCYSLQGLPDSFGCLTNLQHLDLTRCDSLQGLPDSLECLTSLQHLDLKWCNRLQGLPDSFGCLTSLQHLDLTGCYSLQGLPDSFECLTSLQHLDLKGCNSLQALPDSFGCLTSLQHLDLSECRSVKGLPDSFGCLTSLQHFDLTGCDSLQGLPDSFGCLTSLQQFDLSECQSVQGLPHSFGCLTSLQHLDLKWCNSLQGLPDSFGCLTSLHHLDLSYCKRLQVLPDSFGCLKNLQRFHHIACGIPDWATSFFHDGLVNIEAV